MILIKRDVVVIRILNLGNISPIVTGECVLWSESWCPIHIHLYMVTFSYLVPRKPGRETYITLLFWICWASNHVSIPLSVYLTTALVSVTLAGNSRVVRTYLCTLGHLTFITFTANWWHVAKGASMHKQDLGLSCSHLFKSISKYFGILSTYLPRYCSTESNIWIQFEWQVKNDGSSR